MIDSTWGKTKLPKQCWNGVVGGASGIEPAGCFPSAQHFSKGRKSLYFVLCTGVTRCNEVSPFFLRNIYYWPSDFVSVNKIAKRELGQYPVIFTELAWSIKDLLYGTKKHWKNYLRTCLFSSTEKEASYLQKCWRVSIFSFSSSIPTEKSQKILLSSRKIFLRKKTFVQPFGIWRNFIVGTK